MKQNECHQLFAEISACIFMISGNDSNKMLEIIVIGGQYRDLIFKEKENWIQCNYGFMIRCL